MSSTTLDADQCPSCGWPMADPDDDEPAWHFVPPCAHCLLCIDCCEHDDEEDE